jgi:fructose-specific phosphotransferase system IIA component
LKKEFCVMDLQAVKKEDAINEIVSCLSACGKVKDKEKFIGDILERESLGSTGIGKNIAIPHSRTGAVEGFVIGFGRSRDGIDFKSLDGEKVNLVFLMGTSLQELNLYLRLLAELSRLLMENTFRRELLAAKSAEEIIDTFKKFEKT